MNKEYYFSVSITHEAIMSYYQGAAKSVQVTTETGLLLQLPASHFRSFITYTGVQGRFRLTIDQNNKFLRLERC